MASALAAIPACAHAQTSTRPATIGAFFTYGLDAERLRLDRIQRVPRIDGRPYVRTVDAGDGRVGYLLLTLTVKNARNAPAFVPALRTTVRTDIGPAIDPAVAGPFLGDATSPADMRAAIPPHTSATLHLAILDIPNGHAVTEIILSPNDATPEYRFRFKHGDVTNLPPVPR